MALIEVAISVSYIASSCLLIFDNQEICMWIMIGAAYSAHFIHSAFGIYKIYIILYPIIKRRFSRNDNIAETIEKSRVIHHESRG